LKARIFPGLFVFLRSQKKRKRNEKKISALNHPALDDFVDNNSLQQKKTGKKNG
jgi:hypothetical protein